MCVTWLIHMCYMTHPCVYFIIVFMCDITHSYALDGSSICVIWLICMCDMTLSYVWHDSFICVTLQMRDMTHSYDVLSSMGIAMWGYDSFICVTWLIHKCDMTQSYAWHDSVICVTWLFICVTWRDWPIHICGMTRAYAWHDSFMCVSWLLGMRDMTHSCTWLEYLQVWQDSHMRVTWLSVIWRLHVWKDPSIRAVRLLCFFDMNCMRVTRTIHQCDTTQF